MLQIQITPCWKANTPHIWDRLATTDRKKPKAMPIIDLSLYEQPQNMVPIFLRHVWCHHKQQLVRVHVFKLFLICSLRALTAEHSNSLTDCVDSQWRQWLTCRRSTSWIRQKGSSWSWLQVWILVLETWQADQSQAKDLSDREKLSFKNTNVENKCLNRASKLLHSIQAKVCGHISHFRGSELFYNLNSKIKLFCFNLSKLQKGFKTKKISTSSVYNKTFGLNTTTIFLPNHVLSWWYLNVTCHWNYTS